MASGEQLLKPLDMLRALRDADLTTSEFALLVAMVLRADNETGKVRYSIEKLAEDAGMSERTARRVLAKPHVLAWFARIEGRTRARDFWFRFDPPPAQPIPVTVTGIEEAAPVADSGHPVQHSGHPVRDSGHPVHDSGHHDTPSAYTPALSSTSSPALPSAGTRTGLTRPRSPEGEYQGLSPQVRARARIGKRKGLPAS